jgi:hypothetical protein
MHHINHQQQQLPHENVDAWKVFFFVLAKYNIYLTRQAILFYANNYILSGFIAVE